MTVVMAFFAATPFWMLFLSEFLVCRDSLDHNTRFPGHVHCEVVGGRQ